VTTTPTPSPEVLWTPDPREAGNSAVAAFARHPRGVAPDAAVSRDAVRDPDALAPFIDLARASAGVVGRRP
jgi:hypothetical protein